MSRLMTIYAKLEEKYGLPVGQWGLWCRRRKTQRDREEIIIGAILAQNTNWKNVQKALAELKKNNLLSLKNISKCRKSKLARYIKSAGFYNQKAEYLLNVAKFFVDFGGVKWARKQAVSSLRRDLLTLCGVGPETADSIILYACDMPIFVIDEYTKKYVRKEKLTKKFDYQYLQNYFQKRLDLDVKLWQDFHALIVISGKNNYDK